MSLGPLIVDVVATSLGEDDRRRLMHPWVGGVILFSRNFTDREQVAALCAEIRGLPRPEPLLISVDHEGGRIQRFREGFSAIPGLRELTAPLTEALSAAQQDPRAVPAESLMQTLLLCQTRAREAAHCLASELLAVGVDFSYTPVLDLDHGRSAVIGDRSYHRMPSVVSAMAAATMQGLALAGMSNCGKHFPGHGWAEADSHFAVPVDERPLSQILADDAAPYAWLSRGGAAAPLQSVMPAHVIYPQVDDRPAGFSSVWLQDILRQQLGFDGVIISDDLAMAGAEVLPDVVDRAMAALRAGCDAVLLCNRPDLVDVVLAELPGRLGQEPLGQGRRSLARLRPRRHGRA